MVCFFYGEEPKSKKPEADVWRDAILKRMLATPPKPFTRKPKTRPASKGGFHKGKGPGREPRAGRGLPASDLDGPGSGLRAKVNHSRGRKNERVQSLGPSW